MFMFSNIDLSNIFDLDFSVFFVAVEDAYNNVLNALSTFIQLFVSLFNRLSSSNTLLNSFFIIFIASLVVFSCIKIWRS